MYYPYVRGKQFELITIRQMAAQLAQKNVVPVIEPVRESLERLEKTLAAVCHAGGRAITIVNPDHGDYKEDGADICILLKKAYRVTNNISAGILLRRDMTVNEVMAWYDQHGDQHPVFIHAGFTEAKALTAKLQCNLSGLINIFIEDHANLLYRKHFDQSTRILVRDGFKRRRNADYPAMEDFSDLHVTYGDLGMSGFGDFLTIGDFYSEGGGPAYAVAIHLTYIDPDRDNVMSIYHFVSDTKDTPTDPAGKFAQALAKLITKLDSKTSAILETEAIKKFRDLHAKAHFPNLGYVKMLSM